MGGVDMVDRVSGLRFGALGVDSCDPHATRTAPRGPYPEPLLGLRYAVVHVFTESG